MSCARYSRISKYIANRELQGSIALSISHAGRPLKMVKFPAKSPQGPQSLFYIYKTLEQWLSVLP